MVYHYHKPRPAHPIISKRQESWGQMLLQKPGRDNMNNENKTNINLRKPNCFYDNELFFTYYFDYPYDSQDEEWLIAMQSPIVR